MLTLEKLQEVRRNILQGTEQLTANLHANQGALELIERLIVVAQTPEKPAEGTEPAPPATTQPIPFPVEPDKPQP